MLGDIDIMATVAVKDIEKARKFYVDKLGLTARKNGDGMMTLATGNTSLFVYESDFAGTNKATVATWTVDDDVEKYVTQLRSKGVTFEHYNFPGSRLEGDVHHLGEVKGAWFKDPDGNIFHIVGPETTSARGETSVKANREKAKVGTP